MAAPRTSSPPIREGRRVRVVASIILSIGVFTGGIVIDQICGQSGRRTVGPDDKSSVDRTGLQPSGGVAALDVRRGGVNVGPGQRLRNDSDGGDAAGRLASARVDEMVATVSGARGRHGTRSDWHHGDQPRWVMWVFDADPPCRAVGQCCIAEDVATCRQAEVGLIQRGQELRGSLRRPSLHDAAGIDSAAAIGCRKIDRERTFGDLLGLASQLEHLGQLGRTLFDHELASVETADDRIVTVGAEDQVDFAQLVDHRLPGLLPGGAGSMAATQGEADRHAHYVLDVTMNVAARRSLDRCRAHIPASSSAPCNDSAYPSLVTVAPLTMSMSALWVCTVSSIKMGSA